MAERELGKSGPPRESQTLLRERHPNWPKINVITIFYSGHKTKEDMKKLAPLLKNANILFYEDAYGDQVKGLFQDFANLTPATLDPTMPADLEFSDIDPAVSPYRHLYDR